MTNEQIKGIIMKFPLFYMQSELKTRQHLLILFNLGSFGTHCRNIFLCVFVFKDSYMLTKDLQIFLCLPQSTTFVTVLENIGLYFSQV